MTTLHLSLLDCFKKFRCYVSILKSVSVVVTRVVSSFTWCCLVFITEVDCLGGAVCTALGPRGLDAKGAFESLELVFFLPRVLEVGLDGVGAAALARCADTCGTCSVWKKASSSSSVMNLRVRRSDGETDKKNCSRFICKLGSQLDVNNHRDT